MIDRDAEIERAARAIDDAWVEGDFDSRAYATAAIAPLLDRIAELEREHLGALRMVGAMVDTAGGELRVSLSAIQGIRGATLERQSDPRTGDEIYRTNHSETKP